MDNTTKQYKQHTHAYSHENCTTKHEQHTVNKIISRRVESMCNARGQQTTTIIIYFPCDNRSTTLRRFVNTANVSKMELSQYFQIGD